MIYNQITKEFEMIYLSITGIMLLVIFFIIQSGGIDPAQNIDASKDILLSPFNFFIDNIHHNFTHPIAIFMLQIILILVVSNVFSYLLRKIHQPSVVAEIIAGITLGPSILGFFAPDIFNFLFPKNSISSIQFLSQIGLILFMFVVGLEINISSVFKKAKNALMISHFGILFPFLCGTILAYFLYDNYANQNVNFSSFALFIGIAMSITAFPVLARIVKEKGLSQTHIGSITLAAAAIDDISAWLILAAIIAIVKAGTGSSAIFNILMAVIYLIGMFFIIKPMLVKYSKNMTNKSSFVVLVFFVLLVSSYTTEIIGIHALFGAFIAGVIMPNNNRLGFIDKVEDVAIIFLLPLFFVFTGLRTQLQFLTDINFLFISLLIIVVAVFGKLFGATITSKFLGYSWKESFTIGTLMNTRGLMELVVLNIGYDMGIITQELFSMMVLMALFTTFMTGPLLWLINNISKTRNLNIAKE